MPQVCAHWKDDLKGASRATTSVSMRRQQLLGMRLQNLYDLNAKTYMLKLSRSSGQSAEGEASGPQVRGARKSVVIRPRALSSRRGRRPSSFSSPGHGFTSPSSFATRTTCLATLRSRQEGCEWLLADASFGRTPPRTFPLLLQLRKHLRSKRLDDIRQLGVDRIVVFTFGTGSNAYHLILEM